MNIAVIFAGGVGQPDAQQGATQAVSGNVQQADHHSYPGTLSESPDDRCNRCGMH